MSTNPGELTPTNTRSIGGIGADWAAFQSLVKLPQNRYDILTSGAVRPGRWGEMIDRQEHDAPNVGSERSFGVVFVGVFIIVALWPLMHAAGPRLWALGFAGILACITVAKPVVLRPLNILWFRFGILLGRIVGPIVMGFIFFFFVTPTGLIFRLRKKDLLNRGRDPAAPSYWVTRDESLTGSMRNQF